MDPVLELFARPASTPRVLYGEVTVSSPLTVRFPGTSAADAVEGALRLKSYSPAVGETAVLVQVGPAYVAIGALT